MKDKKCKVCKNPFTPQRPLQMVCGILCANKYLAKRKEVKDKKDLSEMKKSLLTHKDYLKMLQVVFNSYIRERDKGKGCISCGTPLVNKFDAGHYFSVGGNASLRFDEDNVFGQCVFCNQHKHGNLIEYGERLPLRIGKVAFEQLKARRNDVNKLSIPELIELTKEYKFKLKELKNGLR